jgi:hypothetical protein
MRKDARLLASRRLRRPARPPAPRRPGVLERLVTIGSLVSVLLVAAGLYYTNRANREQQRLTEHGQITDRYTKAVEQLGSTNLDVRLGAVYALEHIVRDSRDYEPTVIEVLCAFVRRHASQETVAPAGKNPSPLTEDVFAAITVLGRRPDPRSALHSRLDLGGTYLTLWGADLRGAVLAGIDTVGNFDGANLTGADLSGTTLNTYSFLATTMNNADLHESLLENADLEGSTLCHADLRRARLRNAKLNNVDLVGADLRDADLTGAHLTGVSLHDSDLRGARLTGADLKGADLSGAKLDRPPLDRAIEAAVGNPDQRGDCLAGHR